MFEFITKYFKKQEEEKQPHQEINVDELHLPPLFRKKNFEKMQMAEITDKTFEETQKPEPTAEFVLDIPVVKELFFANLNPEYKSNFKGKDYAKKMLELAKDGKIKLYVPTSTLSLMLTEPNINPTKVDEFLQKYNISNFSSKNTDQQIAIMRRYSTPLTADEIKELKAQTGEKGVNAHLSLAPFGRLDTRRKDLGFKRAQGEANISLAGLAGLPYVTTTHALLGFSRPEVVEFMNKQLGLSENAKIIDPMQVFEMTNSPNPPRFDKDLKYILTKYGRIDESYDCALKSENITLKDEAEIYDKAQDGDVPEFCIDSCVALDLFFLYQNNGKYYQDTLNRAHSEYCIQMLRLLKDNKIKFYIPSEALNEIEHKFGKDYGAFQEFLTQHNFEKLSIKRLGKKKLFTRKKYLSRYYCQPLEFKDIILIQSEYGVKNTKNLYQPLFSYNESLGKPIADASIMATSAVAGLPLITVNTLDFIYKNKPEIIAYKNTVFKTYAPKASIPMTPNKAMKIISSGLCPKINPEVADLIRQTYNPRDFSADESYTFEDEKEM